MTLPPESTSRARPLSTYARPPAMATAWVALLGLATYCFSAPRGAEANPNWDDAIGFGCSLAIAGAVAATVAFGIGGRRRWAVELAVSVGIVGAIIALVLVYFLCIDPTIPRRHMNLWEYKRIQGGAGRWVEQLAGYHGPLGAGVGIALGAVAGMLTVLARRGPRLAMGIALAPLFAIASGPGRQFAFDMVLRLGWMLRRLFVPGSISDDQISIQGMIFGAIAGAVIASVSMYALRGSGPDSQRVGRGAGS